MGVRRVSREGGKGPSPPPLEIKKPKKRVIRANFKLFYLYFATFLVENMISSAMFWAGSPLEILKNKQKKTFQIFAPPPLRIPGHATGCM